VTVPKTGQGESVIEHSERWLTALEEAVRRDSREAFDSLFREDACWRDIVALTWDTRQFWGRDAVRDAMFEYAPAAGMANLRLDEERPPPRQSDFVGVPVVEVFFVFETSVGAGKGFARLVPDDSAPQGMRNLMIATALVDLNCAPEVPGRHPRLGFEPAAPGETWRNWVSRKSEFSEHDPDVLIIGGSQSGLSVGARFERREVSYLIVEKNEKPGDTWRNRYDALALHTPTSLNDLPYISLPDHWATFLSKDQWANWLDCYAALMNLNFWGSTEALSAKFDVAARRWEVRLRLAGGAERVLCPRHVVLAVGGVGSTPRRPQLPGLEEFHGEVTHSTDYKSGALYKGKRVMVIGSSTTGHDICLDLYHNGAFPTMAQRGPTCVVNISEVLKFAADYSVMPVEEADQMRSAMSLPLMIRRAQAATEATEMSHAILHDGLRKAGQKLTIGEDKTGWSMKLFRDLAGYYLNVGASEAIVAGHIAILDFEQILEAVPEGVRLRNGETEPFDAIVLATGYNDVSDAIDTLFGHDVAQRIGRCIGVGDDGEYRTMSRPTAQPHLWLINGGIVDARKSSDALALQVIAQMKGLVPTLVRQPDRSVRPL
jgi:cation diffusion facilitator CzcD-associated flavoprotein CzcO